MTTHQYLHELPDESETESLAQRLCALILKDIQLQPPQGQTAAAVIHLSGDLGAGKTTFARAFLRACGITGRIKSPTFALMEVYNDSRLNFYHLDFYRFSDPREWADAGLRDIYQPDSIVLIEWPLKAGAALPVPDLVVELTDHGHGRTALLEAQTSRGTKWLKKLET
ncbi:tRNA (adenosine(37)-N6)-threonylcarbamoyltransferase complex ATPase subunit type 1 TsaE [Orrella sp. 11846]|uniref:tRNA (adenosine(37)-N6)-threonylcarbamoyltransferase complex ATPase subunit type 1 TsaE n=1 Tax=Orrella sp. 11846 TaxID=3409913 RepID=UPI003B5BBDEA